MPLVAVKPNLDGSIPIAPTEAQPLVVDRNTNRLLVDIGSSVALDNLNVNTDQIEGKQDVTNALLTTQAADIATIKAPLSGVTQTSSGGKTGLDVNVISGGGGGGGASAAYNATLPTYTSGASTTLQTDVNGRLITTGGLTDTQLRASAVPVSASTLPLPTGAATSANQSTANSSLANLDADLGNVADAVATSDTGSFSLISLTKRLLGKFAALTDGTQRSQIIQGANTLAVDSSGALTANNAASQVYSFTQTGAITASTVLIGPIDCAQFREVSVHVVSLGTGGTAPVAQISNDGTNWLTAPAVTSAGAFNSNLPTLVLNNIPLINAKNFRIISQGTQTAGTTTLVAYASQQATQKLYQSVTGMVSLSGQPTVTANAAPSVSQGFNTYHTLISAASTNATNVKTSQGTIGTCVLTNTSTTFKYVKFFNLAVAPTMGTSTPVIQFPVAPNSTLDVGTAFAGIRFATGISYAITNGSALLDNTSVGAGEVLVNITYI